MGKAINRPTSKESVPTDSFVKSVFGAETVADAAGIIAAATGTETATCFAASAFSAASAANAIVFCSSSDQLFAAASASNRVASALATTAAAARAISPELLHSVSEVSPPSICQLGVSFGSDCIMRIEFLEILPFPFAIANFK